MSKIKWVKMASRSEIQDQHFWGLGGSAIWCDSKMLVRVRTIFGIWLMEPYHMMDMNGMMFFEFFDLHPMREETFDKRGITVPRRKDFEPMILAFEEYLAEKNGQ